MTNSLNLIVINDNILLLVIIIVVAIQISNFFPLSKTK